LDSEARNKVLAAVVSLLFIVAGGTVIYHYVEGWKWLDALYFAAVTITTVGFGDLAPRTDLGKMFTIFYAFTGIGVALYTLTQVGQIYVEHRVETRIIRELSGGVGKRRAQVKRRRGEGGLRVK